MQCRDFVKAGAEEALTPSDVISAADITFSCVSEPQVAKDVRDDNKMLSLPYKSSFVFIFSQMVFGNCGVLQEMSTNKGFVEMTGIDAETSQDIAEVCFAVNLKIGVPFKHVSFK